MRPLELTLEGFRSYRGKTTFDFRDRRLLGVVGQIGSGKSSILDAVSFALYGKTPSIEGATKSLINQLSDQCHVELIFQVDGEVWRAQRALRRKGQAGHRLEKLASGEPEAEVLEQITGEGSTNSRIEQLLGMDFKAFCRSVLLAQNRFSEFLTATPSQRDTVLKGVFGYERLDAALAVARTRLARAEMQLESLQGERRRIDEARTQLEEARTAATTAAKRSDELEASAEEVEALGRERGAAEAESALASKVMTDLAEIVASLPAPETVELAGSAGAAAEEAVSRAKAALVEAAANRAAAQADLTDLSSRFGDRERFRSFERLVERSEQEAAAVEAAHSHVAAAEKELAETATEVKRSAGAAESAVEGLIEIEESLQHLASTEEEAEGALLAAHHTDIAHELRAGLVPGEPCPVCAQPVHTPPKAGAATKVAAAEKALAKVRSDAAKAREKKERLAAAAASSRTAAEAANETLDRIKVVLADANEEVLSAEAARTATQSQLIEWLGVGDSRSLLASREAELTGAESALNEATAAVEAARVAHDQARDEADRTKASISELANRLTGAWGRLGHDRPLEADAAALAASFAELGETIVSGHETAEGTRADAGARVEAAGEQLAASLSALGLSAGEDFSRARADAAAQRGSAEQRVRTLEEQIAAGGELERGIVAAENEKRIAERLAKDLQPSRFLAFLLEEERADLADLGSEHFERLTDGNFRFSQDGTFNVLDLNAAGAERKADSLSGGETFLASLALALALSEMVARGGGRLDAFFLDEGFGSLDPEHLERAMDGIGRLVASDEKRLVVLVSHVAEMREAIEDLIELRKDDVTGDTVVVSGAVSAVRRIPEA